MKPITYKIEYIQDGQRKTVFFCNPKKARKFAKMLTENNRKIIKSKPRKERISKKRHQEYNRKNSANSLDKKGIRYYIKAGVKEIKRLLGNLALKIRTATTSGYVEIIHSDNRGNISRILRENNYKIEHGK